MAAAGTADTLATARTIWGQSFNGSANVTGALSGVTTLAMSGQLTNTVATGTAPMVVSSTTRVANLNVAAAGTADTLATARTINGVSFNGSANINVPNILAANGTTALATTGVTSAVNHLAATNSATGGAVLLTTAGTDTNIGLNITTKGDGAIVIDTGTGAGQIDLKPGASNVRIWDDDSSHYWNIATGNIAANYTLTLPAGNVTLPAGTLVPTTGTGATGTWGISITGSAPTLTTTRTLWGQNFNGSANVTGALSSVTTLSMSGQLTNTVATGTAPMVVSSTTRVANLNVATAGTADTLTTGRTIGMTGDVTWTSASFNGSANVTGTATLANSGVVAGTYTKLTVDAKGRATAGASLTAADIPELTLAKLPGAAFKQSVRCATTANITLSGTQTIDGVSVVAGDRVLVKNQTTGSQNGIYVVAAGAWTRALDADNASEIGAAVVNVDSGTVNGGELWTTTFRTTDTLGTTSMNWYEVLYNIGTWGISITGSAASLTTARTINGVGFNGSANINVPNLLASNGTTALATTGVTSAVNYLSTTNAATGGAVSLTTAGSDTNIGLNITTKGAGAIVLDTGTGAGQIDLKPGASNVRIWDDNSSHYWSIVTGNVASNYTLTLPAGNVTLPAGTLVPTTGTGASGTWGISVSGSAATLTTTRTLWGQNFNGSANVTGALTGVTTLSASGALTSAGLSNSANLTFTGTGNRITGDFSNATPSNRVAFQTSTANAATAVTIFPNGTSDTSALQLYSVPTGTNSSVLNLLQTASLAMFLADRTGTGGFTPMVFHAGGTERLRIDTSGNLLVGTTIPYPGVDGLGGSIDGAMLEYAGTGFFSRSGGFAALSINRGTDGTVVDIRRASIVVGTIAVSGVSTFYNTSSDYRLKDITGPVTGARDFILALKPKQGTWKADGSKFVGFLAHEFQEVSPSSVSGEKDEVDADGKPVYQAMQASSAEVIANIIALLQEQQATLEAQAARIAQLEKA